MPNREKQRKRVYEILKSSKDRDIAELYDFAIWIFQKMDHPKKIPVAAYCLREVMDGLGLEPYDNLSDHVQKLLYAWEKGENDIKKVIDGTFEAKDNDNLVRFLKKCEPIFSELKKRPTIENQIISALERDDPSKAPVPMLLRKRTAKTLKDLRRDCTTMLHREKKVNPEYFSKILDRFEEIILSVNRPRTFDNQKLIDELIARFEKNDQ